MRILYYFVYSFCQVLFLHHVSVVYSLDMFTVLNTGILRTFVVDSEESTKVKLFTDSSFKFCFETHFLFLLIRIRIENSWLLLLNFMKL